MRNDAVPDEVLDEASTRKTLELCGHQHRALRCMLLKGHAGMHECVQTPMPVRWPARVVP